MSENLKVKVNNGVSNNKDYLYFNECTFLGYCIQDSCIKIGNRGNKYIHFVVAIKNSFGDSSTLNCYVFNEELVEQMLNIKRGDYVVLRGELNINTLPILRVVSFEYYFLNQEVSKDFSKTGVNVETLISDI